VVPVCSRPVIPLAAYAVHDIILWCGTGHTDQFEQWWDTLGVPEQQAIDAAVSLLEQRGPGLGRPLVDGVKGSRHQNMKELRAGTIRVVFAFDPKRTAILLIGGDKRGRWQEFYAQMIPLADELFDEHLAETEGKGGP
jgi:hypothetical protein